MDQFNNKKPAAIYEPGELERTRKNLGNIDKDEALKMIKTLGGEKLLRRLYKLCHFINSNLCLRPVYTLDCIAFFIHRIRLLLLFFDVIISLTDPICNTPKNILDIMNIFDGV